MGYIKKMLIDIADCDGYSIEDNIYNNKNNIHPITDNSLIFENLKKSPTKKHQMLQNIRGEIRGAMGR